VSTVTDDLSLTFAALADPTRRSILAQLAVQDSTVNELAAPFSLTVQAISKHLKVLERAGLILRGREAQWRPCRLDAGPLKDAASCIEDYRRFWSAHVDAVERHLDRMNPVKPANKKEKQPTRPQPRTPRRK